MSATTTEYFPFVANMRCSLKRATGDPRVLVVALDPDVIQVAYNAGINPATIGNPSNTFLLPSLVLMNFVKSREET